MDYKIKPTLLREESVLSTEDQSMLDSMYEDEGEGIWRIVAGDDPLDERRLERNSCTYKECMEQPDRIRETLALEKDAIAEAAALFTKRSINQIYMVGCGDSVAALRGTRFFIEELLNIPCKEEDAMDFAYYNSSAVDENTLVLTLSSSGRTIRVVEALLVARAKGAQTLALSNTADSPLMRAATAGVIIHASRKGWPTQSSTSAMAAVIQLAFEMAKCLGIEKAAAFETEFRKIPDLMAEAARMTEEKMKALAAALYKKNIFFFAGAGPFFTCAEYGAAKVKESTPAYAVPVPMEEFHHYNTVKAGDPLFIITPPGASANRALETIWACNELGGTDYVLTAESEKTLVEEAYEVIILPEVCEYFANFVYAVPLQLFGYFLSVEREAEARRLLEK